MTTTDRDLEEQIARAIATRNHPDGEEAWRVYWSEALALAPIVKAACAEAWELCADTAGDLMGIGGVPFALELHDMNPHREEPTR